MSLVDKYNRLVKRPYKVLYRDREDREQFYDWVEENVIDMHLTIPSTRTISGKPQTLILTTIPRNAPNYKRERV